MRKWGRAALLSIGSLLVFSTCSMTEPDGTLHVIHSCSRADTVTMTIDGTTAGTVAKGASTDFSLKPGSHTASGRSGNGVTWSSRTLSITGGQRTIFDLIC
jgi:hypothetical protein